MKYSVIVPIYNVEEYLENCVDSILRQSFTDFEVILVDDGSPDSCPLICDEYAKRDSRIKVIHKTNGGLSDARNLGLDNANGEYVIFLDSDDWWDDCDALAKIDECTLKNSPTIIIFGGKKFYTLEQRYGDLRTPSLVKKACIIRPEDHFKAIMQSNIFQACAWDKAIRRDYIERNHLRFVKGQLSEDIEWCIKLLMYNPTVEILEVAFHVYRQQVNTSITSNVGKKNISDILEVIKKYADQIEQKPLLNFLANQYVLLITNLMILSQEDRKLLESQIKQYWWLLEYNWYPYVRKVFKIKFLGFDIVKHLLIFYYRNKR